MLSRDIRNRVVPFSDESFAKWIVHQGLIKSSSILPESLANEIRRIFPYYRLAHTFLEELHFVPGMETSFQSCLACPSNKEQALLFSTQLSADGFFAANRFLSKARKLRDIDPGYLGSLLIDPKDVIEFMHGFGHLASTTCGQHKSNNGNEALTKSHKDETGILGVSCGHGMMLSALFMTTGERFVYLAQLLTRLFEAKPWLMNVILSYDIGCKFMIYLMVRLL